MEDEIKGIKTVKDVFDFWKLEEEYIVYQPFFTKKQYYKMTAERFEKTFLSKDSKYYLSEESEAAILIQSAIVALSLM